MDKLQIVNRNIVSKLSDIFNSFGESIDWEFSARTILKNRKD